MNISVISVFSSNSKICSYMSYSSGRFKSRSLGNIFSKSWKIFGFGASSCYFFGRLCSNRPVIEWSYGPYYS